MYRTARMAMHISYMNSFHGKKRARDGKEEQGEGRIDRGAMDRKNESA